MPTWKGGTVKTVVLEVQSLADTLAEASQAMQAGRTEQEAHISFATPELLWQVLTARRWELLKTLCGAGSISIREAAKRVGRDVRSIRGDIDALVNAGVLTRGENGDIEFPYETVKVEFMLQAA